MKFFQSKTLMRKQAAIILSASLVLFFSSCANDNTATSTTIDSTNTTSNESSTAKKELKPAGDAPAWAPSITDEMQVVMDKLASYGDPAIETVSAEKARTLHTPTDAVMDVMKEHSIAMPAPGCDTTGKEISVNGGTIHARIYTPKGATAAMPVIVYYHGGGWVIANINVYGASAQSLCEQTGAVVVAVEYRQGPEHKFPTAHNDAFAAYQWVLKNAASLNVDTARIAVAGESAGGNLACNVSIMARDKGIKMPTHQLLVYPVANNDMNSESYLKYAAAKPLNKPMMEWFAKNYLPNMAAAADARISLVKANLKGLPPTTIIAAEIDPLTTEGKLLADKLKEAGVTVDYKLYDGVTHEFFGMGTVIPQAKDAMAKAAGNLKGAWN
ncbi:MAG: alpha/beta hydrolase [Bacteroidota bacterium]